MTRRESMAAHPSGQHLFAAERLTGWAESWLIEATDYDTQSDVVLANAATMSDKDPAKDHERAYGYALADLAKLRRHQAAVITGTAESSAFEERSLRLVQGEQ